MKPRLSILPVLGLGLLLLAGAGARADVTPNPLFADGMVLQQGMKVPVWGTAADGEEVTVTLQGQTVKTKAKDGKWQVQLEKLKAGGPFEMTVAGKNSVALKNVLVGEVWICSGQSNMQWSVNQSADPAEVKAASKNPNIRLFTVPRKPAEKPQTTVQGQWKECGPETVGDFSAVAYHFGRHLQKNLDVPIGLISTNVGGTRAEAWTSRAALEAMPQYKTMVEAHDKALAKYPADLDAHKKAVEKAKQDKQPEPKAPANPLNANSPSGLYNAMIAPLVPYAMKGAIWYQGESNAGQAYAYRTLFPAMIQNWRDDWKQGDFPFLCVQLAPYMAIVAEPQESNWAELREAQLLTALKFKNTGMAVITDVGDPKDIHPKQKEPVGTRLALAARALAYDQKIVYSGPIYDSLKIDADKAILSFKHVGGGLVCKGDKLTGFTIAGEDKKFFNADARILDDKIVVTSPMVAKPVAVRFGWANHPIVNLWNKDGLPASPFRTDTFPGLTEPKKPAASGQ